MPTPPTSEGGVPDSANLDIMTWGCRRQRYRTDDAAHAQRGGAECKRAAGAAVSDGEPMAQFTFKTNHAWGNIFWE